MHRLIQKYIRRISKRGNSRERYSLIRASREKDENIVKGED